MAFVSQHKIITVTTLIANLWSIISHWWPQTELFTLKRFRLDPFASLPQRYSGVVIPDRNALGMSTWQD